MAQGIIMKALSGYYYVLDQAGGAPVQCRARGIFKKRGESPLVGDQVEYEKTENGEGMVDRILPRRTELIRPPVANADLAVLVFSVVRPELNLLLLDKFLLHIEHTGLDALLVWTKTDRIPEGPEGDEVRAHMERASRLYTSIGYEVLVTSSLLGDGIADLQARLAGHIAVFAGQSGVGKSSLLNALVPGLTIQTSEISERLGRGKHTTRHVELVPLPGGGIVADTPGFSQLDFTELGIEDIGSCFREFRELSAGCKFRGCTHIHEPNCAVRAAVDRSEAAQSRYDHYKEFMIEWKEKPRRY
jgi:ribosome biogenesis GTPase